MRGWASADSGAGYMYSEWITESCMVLISSQECSAASCRARTAGAATPPPRQRSAAAARSGGQRVAAAASDRVASRLAEGTRRHQQEGGRGRSAVLERGETKWNAEWLVWME